MQLVISNENNNIITFVKNENLFFVQNIRIIQKIKIINDEGTPIKLTIMTPNFAC